MKYRLGLDLGTNSIGWAIAEITDDDGLQLADAGVRIFTDGREPASGDRIGDPLAVQRRKARAARRQRDRRKRRQKLVMSELVRSGLLPHSREARKAWLHHAADGEFSIEPRRLARSVMERIFKILGRPLFLKRTDTELFDQRNPYYLRTKALDERLAPFELGRVLMHLSLHRGFKSNRKTDRTDDEASKTYDRIRTLRTRLGETGSRTLGEFLWKRYVAGDPVRFRPGRTDFYPDRAMYQDEFETIRSSQQAYHPNVNWDRLRELMYYQRPLRPVERGKCRYYPEEVRGYADLPSVARFRILQEVSNLAFVDSDGSLVGLSNEEKDRLAHELYSAASKSFDGIRKLIGTSAKFNLEDGKRAKLGGDEISFQMMKTEHAGDTWEELSLEQKDAVVEALHRADDNAELIEELRVLLPGLSDQQYEAICGVRVKTRTASVSARFARECGRVMERDHVGYDQATNRLGLSHYDSGEAGERESLPYYGEVLRNSVVGADPSVRLDPSAGIREYEKRYGKITNVTVHIALNQLRKLVNALIVRYGKPHEIVVELGRELKLSQRKISEIVSEQEKNQKKNERIARELESLGITRPSRLDILKYELWEELGTDQLTRSCVYCGRPISAHELISESTEIEHILPYSRTLLNSKSNLTVAHKSCNNAKGDRTPYEAFAANPTGFRYEDILARARVAFRGKGRNGSKLKNFTADAMSDIPEVQDFLVRQQTDNAYIARAAKEYLSSICNPDRIWATVGRLTAAARRTWGLDSILSNRDQDGRFSKNRYDHRHHAIDAIAACATDRRLVQQVALMSSGKDRRRRKDQLSFPECPFSREKVEAMIARVIPSIRVNHSDQGRLFNETALGSHAYHAAEREPNDDGRLWAHRKSIQSLTAKDVASGIVDPVVRMAVRSFVEKHPGKKLADVLTQFSEETGIRRVRIATHTQTPKPIPSAPYKAYEGAGVLYCEIWEIPGKRSKYEGVYWTLTDAAQRESGEDRRPHPAAKKLMRVYKHDTLQLRSENNRTFAVVRSFAAQKNKLDLRPVWAADSVATWCGRTPDRLVAWPLRRPPGQNHESINKLFSTYDVRKCVITPDGRLISR